MKSGLRNLHCAIWQTALYTYAGCKSSPQTEKSSIAKTVYRSRVLYIPQPCRPTQKASISLRAYVYIQESTLLKI